MEDPLSRPTALSGANAEFLESLYQQFLQQPESVDPQWRQFFGTLPNGNGSALAQAGARPAPPQAGRAPAADDKRLTKQAAVFQLINNFRAFGHTRAALDPLGQPHMPKAPDLSLAYFGLAEAELDEQFSTGTLVAPPSLKLREILEMVRRTYAGSVGVEYMHVRNQAERAWLQQAMEGTQNQPNLDKETRRGILL
ncbi:MAG TPA: 2-oxoglutarate dehydrogenase E1 component, partial [bacterium]|nr:2-oxoglutarate dehydrogenase E1 component [bacterium]